MDLVGAVLKETLPGDNCGKCYRLVSVAVHAQLNSLHRVSHCKATYKTTTPTLCRINT